MLRGRTVITGLSALTSIGPDLETTMKGLRLPPAPALIGGLDGPGLWPSFVGHPIGSLPLRDYLTRADLTYLTEIGLAADRDLHYLLAALRMALSDSRIDDLGSGRVGLLVAHENPGVTNLIGDLMGTFFETPPAGLSTGEYAIQLFRRHRQGFFHVQPFPHLFHVARLLGITGYSLYVNNACASGLYALEAAHQAVVSGRVDAAVVAASDYAAEPTKQMWFEELGLYSRSGRTRPFSRGRDGFLVGDAGCALVLESLEHALRRNAPIYGEYKGGAFVQEAWQMTLPDVAGGAYGRCMADAMRQAGVAPDEIDLVAAHATATSVGDRYEAMSLARAFEGARLPPVIGFKPYVGHTLGASALLESILLLACMTSRWVPGVPGYEPDPLIGLPVRTEPGARKVRYALKTVNAFAGFDAAVVLGEVLA